MPEGAAPDAVRAMAVATVGMVVRADMGAQVDQVARVDPVAPVAPVEAAVAGEDVEVEVAARDLRIISATLQH